MSSAVRTSVVAALALGLLGCPPPARAPRPTTTVVVDGTPPALPGGFAPAAPLPPPPGPDPEAFGADYLAHLHGALLGPWGAFLEDCRLRLPPDHPLNAPALQVVLDLRVRPDGEFASVEVVAPSGNAAFDAVAREVAREAGPLPPAPAGLVSDDGDVYLRWTFARDARQAGGATAEVRRFELPAAEAVPRLLAAGDWAEAARRIDRAATSGTAAASLVEPLRRVAAASLASALEHPAAAVRRAAAEAVAEAAATAAAALQALAPALQGRMQAAVDPEVRAAAIRALGALDHRDSVPELQRVLGEELGTGAEVATAAARALDRLGAGAAVAEAYRAALGAGEPARLERVLDTVAQAPQPAALDEVRRLAGHAEAAVRAAACRALGPVAVAARDTDAHKAVRRGFEDRDATVRAGCALAGAMLAEAGLGSRSTFWLATDLLKDRDERVRAAAVRAVLALEPALAPRELSRSFRDKSPVVQAALAEGLGRASGSGGEPPAQLVTLASSPVAAVRVAAVRALAGRAEARARALAAGMAVDPEPAVRLAALPAVDDPAQLAALAADPVLELALRAMARRIVVTGQATALAEVASTLGGASEEPGAAVVRAWAAGAWLSAP